MNQKSTTYIIVALFVILAGAAGYLLPKSLSGNSVPSVKTYNFVLKDQQYSPDTVTVKLGDTVVFNIDNQDNENHGLHLPDFGVVQAVPPLQKTSVQFEATKTGTVSTSCATDHPEKIQVIVES